MQRLTRARELNEAGEYDAAIRICNEILDEDPDNGLALFIAASCMSKVGHFGLSYNLYRHCMKLYPERAEVYINAGMCLEYADPQKALGFLEVAGELDPDSHHVWMDQGIMQLRLGNPQKCKELCLKALRLKPDSSGAHQNLALAHLMLREWKEGWYHYQWGLGGSSRKKHDYGVPEWDGKSPGTVVVYGEQGIGDEILFASCIPDAMEHAGIIINCDSRLAGVFRRSFGCPVYGDRTKNVLPWMEDHQIDYQCSIGELPRFYRNAHADFPQTSYLTPDPERCLQWRALLDTYPGRKIGLAWNGGIVKTMTSQRSFDFDTFAPLLDTGDTYISLEYNPPGDIPIPHWPRATEKAADFDETLALINELDLVISVCTTVIHGAGAIGKECWCLVPEIPGYRYHLNGNLPWYGSVKSFRQEGDWPIVKLRQKLLKEALAA